MGQCRYKANRSVPTHAKVPNIIEEDHARSGLWIDGFAEKRADYNFRSAWFANHSTPKVIEFALQTLEPILHISCSEIRSTGNDNARRFSFCVGIDCLNPSL
jgi:hypothetical protein